MRKFSDQSERLAALELGRGSQVSLLPLLSFSSPTPQAPPPPSRATPYAIPNRLLFFSRTPDDRFSGNGGLSLRRASAIRRVLAFQSRFNDTNPEDEWFGRRLSVLPGEKVAKGLDGVLAVEEVYVEKPMGFHIRDGGKSLKDEVWK